MILARRVAVAAATLVGLVVAVLGLWLAVVLGPSGTASFTARATGPVVVGADVLGGLDVPVTVSAHRGEGDADGVFLGEARSSEVADVVGGSRVLRATEARFPARVLDLLPAGSGVLVDPSGLDVWRATGRGTLEVTDAGSDAVLVAPTSSDPVTVVVTRQHSTWFLEAVVAAAVGVIVAGAAGWWLVQQLGHLVPLGRPGARRPRDPSPGTTPTPESSS
ncbi:MAG: hypothetical protein M3Y71_15190 [Actinomycetota bacterium]|nr:hypothetical protein [Actinomycetota bacterium]